MPVRRLLLLPEAGPGGRRYPSAAGQALERQGFFRPDIDVAAAGPIGIVSLFEWECVAMDAGEVEGRCLCGEIVFRYEGTPNWTVHCHCESCRRATSSPMTTWISVPRSGFAVVKGTPRYFGSSPGVRRGFCGDCGSPLSYESAHMPDEVHLYAASLVDPAPVLPSRHVFVAEQVSWLEVLDDLPRYATTSRGGASPVRIGPRKS